MLKIHKLPNANEYGQRSPIRLGPNVGVVLFKLGHWLLVRWDYWIW